jgi:uncharacterized membrane protein HdeD (DUF308 family)
MSQLIVERRRTAWDMVLGVILVVLGLVVLGHVLIATTVSVIFLGWLAVISGIVGIIAAFMRIGRGGFWFPALTGGLLLVLGIFFLRHPTIAALTLTLLAGALFLATGITRLIAAFENQAFRWPLLISGIVSAVLGLIVLANLFEASLVLLGTLLAIETIADGITLLVFGRVHVDTGHREGSLLHD